MSGPASPAEQPRIAGAVLAGGESSRMGVDKATIELEGVTLLVRSVDALRRAGIDPVVVVGGGDATAALARSCGASALDDLVPGAGPLAAVATALGALRDSEAVVVVACDHPDLDPPSLRRLADTLRASPTAIAAVPVPRPGGPIDVLHAAYRPSLLPVLAEALERDERSLRRVLEELVVVRVPVASSSLVDLDTPDDLGRRSRSGPPHALPSTSMDPAVPTVDVAELRALLAAGPINLIDVREPDEHREARVPGIRPVPLQTVPDVLSTIPTDGPVYVICAAGGRSLRAAQFLRANGVDAVNVTGGTNAWIQAGFDVESGPVS